MLRTMCMAMMGEWTCDANANDAPFSHRLAPRSERRRGYRSTLTLAH